MVLAEAAFMLASLGMEEGFKELEGLGITGDIKSKLLQLRTKYMMFLAKEKAKEVETASVDFYEMLGSITINKKVSISLDISLIEWIGILKAIKEQNEWENRAIRGIHKGGN
jgi:hypothetical protein